MSSRRDRRDAERALSDLERSDLEQVVKAQQYVVGVTTGQRQFEHPGSPHLSPGSRYMPNQREITFSAQSRSTLMGNFFRFLIVGSFTPYITLRMVSIMQKRIIPTPRYVIWSSLGGGFGGMYGLTMGRMAIARDYLKLDNSPLATEARFQLWKLNPSHPFLKGFEHETVDWNEYKYDRNYSDRDSDRNRQSMQRYDDYDRNNKGDRYRDRDRQSDYNEYSQSDRMDTEEMGMDEHMRRKKRDAFYSGRNRVNNKSFGDGYDDDVSDFFDSDNGKSPHDDASDFFDSDNGKSPHDDASDFFEGDNKQKWD